MKNNFDKNRGVQFLLSFIYPFGAFLYSWKDLKSRYSHLAFFVFFVCFGFCFNAVLESADSSRYVMELNIFSVDPSGNWSRVVNDYFSPQSETKDIFLYTVFYLTCIFFGNNAHVFFAIIAIVFGYFYLRSLTFITNDDEFRNTRFYIILALIFTLSNPIFNINGCRYYTAAWIAVYATFQILLNKKRQYLLLIIILPLVHGSYYIFWIFFLIAYLVRHFYKFLPYLFFISFFFTDITLQIIPDFSGYLPPFLQTMVFNYTESNEALARMSGEEAAQEALYARILMMIPRYYHVLMIFLLVRSQKLFKDKKSKEFLGFILAYGSLVNISSMIPSMMRYWALLIPMYIYLWVHNGQILYKYKKVVLAYLLVALYPTFRILRLTYYMTDPILYFSNTFHIIIKGLIS